MRAERYVKWDEQRQRLLAKAAEDERAMAVLAADATTADAVVGFHAQQAVEKCLKALLCHFHVNYHRTHDLVLLLDALTDTGHVPPSEVDRCKYLQPYAVRFRYDDIPMSGNTPLNRLQLLRDVEGVRQWVMQTIANRK